MRRPRLPLSARELVAILRAARAANFATITVEINGVKITASDKQLPDGVASINDLDRELEQFEARHGDDKA